MDDQRVEVGPALGAIDRGDRRLAVGARGEAVNRLGRHRDQPAPTQDFGSPGDPGLVGGNDHAMRRATRPGRRALSSGRSRDMEARRIGPRDRHLGRLATCGSHA